MAVAQAQHRVRELYDQLTKRGIDVQVRDPPGGGPHARPHERAAGRGRDPYTALVEMDDINPDMPQVDVAIVVGANDVVNPAARHDKTSPIFGMPIINADKARTVIAIKRTMNPGFAGIENELYYADNCLMAFGDAKAVLGDIVKALSGEKAGFIDGRTEGPGRSVPPSLFCRAEPSGLPLPAVGRTFRSASDKEHAEISMRRLVTALVLAAAAALVAVPPSRGRLAGDASRSAMRAWRGGARRASACSSTGASTRCPPASTRASASKDIGEWIMSWANIPRAEYEQFADAVQPGEVRRRRVGRDREGRRHEVHRHHVQAPRRLRDVRQRGQRLRHRRCARRSRRTRWRRSRPRRRRQGCKFCFYYSIMDWHHPSQYVDAPGKDRTAGNGKTEIMPGPEGRPTSTYMKAQLKELSRSTTRRVLWFDGEWMDWWTEEDGQDLYAYVRGLKPDIIINNRVGKGRKGMEGLNKTDRDYAGDFGTPEQQIPANGIPGVDWESCMTMNDTWGFKSYDDNWKSAETLVRNLIDIASKGGNYLLNVGPTAEGEIPAASASSAWPASANGWR